jgi:hypothetical protein
VQSWSGAWRGLPAAGEATMSHPGAFFCCHPRNKEKFMVLCFKEKVSVVCPKSSLARVLHLGDSYGCRGDLEKLCRVHACEVSSFKHEILSHFASSML